MGECSTVQRIMEGIKDLGEWGVVEEMQRLGLLMIPENHCKGGRIIKIRRVKYKCSICGYEFSPKQGSPFEGLRIPYWKILAFYKLFISGFNYKMISQILNLSKPTTLRLLRIFKGLNEKTYREAL